jgi:hypothetical protein
MQTARFLCILAASLGMAAQAGAPGNHAPAAAAQVPSGATKVDANTWTWRDAKGTEWTFRKTPFGLTRYRAQDVNRPVPPQQKPDTKVTDLGSAWRFERQTPFGPQIWVKKKTAELNAEEKALVSVTLAPVEPQGK